MVAAAVMAGIAAIQPTRAMTCSKSDRTNDGLRNEASHTASKDAITCRASNWH